MAAPTAQDYDAMMEVVPAGEFLMGDEKRKVRVAAFQVDRYPVTNAQYRRFVEATGRRPPSHWKGSEYPPWKDLHPVVCITWHDAAAYAEWLGKRLLDEEEWEKAARGTDGREYPWGQWKERYCNCEETGIKNTTPVGLYSPDSDSPYGRADMAGNVWEWTASDYDTDHCVVRGGSWRFGRVNARCASRFWFRPEVSSVDLGFRCAAPA